MKSRPDSAVMSMNGAGPPALCAPAATSSGSTSATISPAAALDRARMARIPRGRTRRQYRKITPPASVRPSARGRRVILEEARDRAVREYRVGMLLQRREIALRVRALRLWSHQLARAGD